VSEGRITRPTTDEDASYDGTYINKVPERIEKTSTLLASISESKASMPARPGNGGSRTWSAISPTRSASWPIAFCESHHADVTSLPASEQGDLRPDRRLWFPRAKI